MENQRYSTQLEVQFYHEITSDLKVVKFVLVNHIVNMTLSEFLKFVRNRRINVVKNLQIMEGGKQIGINAEFESEIRESLIRKNIPFEISYPEN